MKDFKEPVDQEVQGWAKGSLDQRPSRSHVSLDSFQTTDFDTPALFANETDETGSPTHSSHREQQKFSRVTFFVCGQKFSFRRTNLTMFSCLSTNFSSFVLLELTIIISWRWSCLRMNESNRDDVSSIKSLWWRRRLHSFPKLSLWNDSCLALHPRITSWLPNL